MKKLGNFPTLDVYFRSSTGPQPLDLGLAQKRSSTRSFGVSAAGNACRNSNRP